MATGGHGMSRRKAPPKPMTLDDITTAMARPLGRKVAQLAKEHGLSQRDMAELLGIALPTMEHRFSGRSPFSLAEIAFLSRHFGVSIDSLVTLTISWELAPALTTLLRPKDSNGL